MDKNIYKKDAKDIVDKLFETKMLSDEVTRDDMSVFEDLVEFLLSSKFESYQRITKLSERIGKINQ